MSKNRPNQPAADRESAQRVRGRRPGQLPAVVRIAISLMVIWHVTLVFMAPLSVSVSNPDSIVTAIAQRPPMQWYLDVLYLNHGYHFFAPDPGAGHLIRYHVYDERGSVIRQGEFPNLKDQWPRLRYHRHFMLADQCELPAPSQAEADQWLREYLTSYARELLRQFDGQTVRVERIVHYPLLMDDALRGEPLTYPRTYETQMEVTQRRQDLDLPAPDQAGGWNNPMRRDVAGGWQGGPR